MLKLTDVSEARPVELEELKRHVHAADFADDDKQLEVFLDAATDFVAERTSLTLRESTFLVERCDWWSGCLQVMLAPVSGIAIRYLDAAGVRQTVAPALYRWGRTALGTAEIRFLGAFTSPAVKVDTHNAVQIEIEAGFSDPSDPELKLPNQARQAILMLAAAWYRNRDAVSADDLKTVPLAADALIAQLRVYR